MNQSFLTGEQFEIRRGDMRAVITELGAGLRLFSIADQAVIDGFSEREMPSFGRGQVLIPFPNRVASGRYVFQIHPINSRLLTCSFTMQFTVSPDG